MATIKKSELDQLRKDVVDLDREAAMWCKFTVQYMNKTNNLKEKLWAAEQEIHDLKKPPEPTSAPTLYERIINFGGFFGKVTEPNSGPY